MRQPKDTLEREFEQITRLARERGPITSKDVSERLSLSMGQAYYRLSLLVERGVLTRTNRYYSLSSRTIRPAERADAILSYLNEYDTLGVEDAAAFLRIGRERAKRLMDGMVMDGRLALIRETRKYTLPPAAKEGVAVHEERLAAAR